MHTRTSPNGSHLALLQAAVPAWLKQASPALREAYFKSSLTSLRSANQAADLINQFESPQAFCAPLLQAALDNDFPTLKLDVRKHSLVRMKHDRDLWTVRLEPQETTLLACAMHNFEAQEAATGGLETGSAILQTGALYLHVKPDYRLVYSYPKNARMDLPPERFTALCRRLDLGRQYQDHFKAVFQPLPSHAGPTDETQRSVTATLAYHLRDSLDAAAVQARIRGHISAAAHRMIMQFTQPTEIGGLHSWAGDEVQYCQLSLLNTHLRTGNSLLGMLSIERKNGQGGCVVYMPGEPEAALREYDSLEQFERVLREKLRNPDYRHYFSRFISHRSAVAFFERLEATLNPQPFSWPGQFSKPASADPNADIGLRSHPVAGPLSRLMYDQLLIKLSENARAVVVPTDDEDAFTREKRIAWYESLLGDAVGAASFFVPGLGELMAAAGALDLIRNVCVGVDDWTHGQREEALAHLRSVATNLALLGGGIATGIAIARSPFMEALEPIVDAAGKPALVSTDMSRYAADVVMPAELTPNALGQYTYLGKTYVRLEDQVFEQYQDPITTEWALEHPRLAARYRPPMKHNGEGSWQHVHEHPLEWQEPTLLRRLGPLAEGLSDAELLRARQACAVSEAQLRQCHVERQPAPAALRDALLRSRSRSGFKSLQEQLHKGGELGEGADYCVPLLLEQARWPKDIGIRLTADDGTFIDYGKTDSQGRRLQLTRGDLRAGTWAQRTVDQLLPGERTALFADSVGHTVADQVRALCEEVASLLEAHEPGVVEALRQRGEPALLAEAKCLRRDFGSLTAADANALANTANAWERGQLASGKVPIRLAEQARLCLREQRLSMAIEGLDAQTVATEDRDRLALGLLPHLSGWRSTVRLELHTGQVHGELRAVVGDALAAELKYIVKRPEGYQAFDSREQELSGVTHLFDAIEHALPDAQRVALALPGKALDEQVFALAIADRPRASRLIGQRALHPWFRVPVRVGDRLGYELSGRGGSSWGQRRRLRRLFPSLDSRQLAALESSLPLAHETLDNSLLRLETEYAVLDKTLEEWASEEPLARNAAAMSIRQAWRKGSRSLVLINQTSLPLITANFEHVTHLALTGAGLTEDPSLLLSRFPNLNVLNLCNNALHAIPAQVGKMPRLLRLDMSLNRLDVTDSVFDALAPSRLARLHLSGAFAEVGDSVLSERMMQPLTRLTHLEMLDLSSNNLGFSEQALQSLGSLPKLKTLMLQENAIELTPATRGVFSGLREIQTLSLNDNPLSVAPDLSGLRNLRNLGLRGTYISEFPPGLMELMSQWVVNLLHINLSDNLLVQLPAVSETGYVRLLHSGFQRDMRINLNLNPLDEAALSELRSARIPFAGARRAALAPAIRDQEWQQGCPSALAASITVDRGVEEAAGFYDIMDQIPRTAGYLNDPQAYRERMWALMRCVLGQGSQVDGDGLGVDELRAQVFDQASLVTETCGDGISVVLDAFEVTVLAWKAASTAAGGRQSLFAPLLKLARQLYRVAVIDECSVIIAQDRRLRHEALQLGERRVPNALDTLSDASLRDSALDDEAEIRLTLRNRLQQRLGLLEQPAMRFGEVVEQQTVDNVAAAVLARDTDSGLLDWLVQQKFWEVYCRKAEPRPFETLGQRWDDVLSVYQDISDDAKAFELQGERLLQALDLLKQFDAQYTWHIDLRPVPVSLNEARQLELYAWMRDSRSKALDALLTRIAREHVQLAVLEVVA
jgi:Leucine-rich repeat (LRR) protein